MGIAHFLKASTTPSPGSSPAAQGLECYWSQDTEKQLRLRLQSLDQVLAAQTRALLTMFGSTFAKACGTTPVEELLTEEDARPLLPLRELAERFGHCLGLPCHVPQSKLAASGSGCPTCAIRCDAARLSINAPLPCAFHGHMFAKCGKRQLEEIVGDQARVGGTEDRGTYQNL